MALTLSPELEERVRRVVNSGRYSDPQQALESAVHHLEAEDELLSGWTAAELQAEIDAGLDSVRREPLVTPAEAKAYLAGITSESVRG